MLSNSTWKLLQFEITKKLCSFEKKIYCAIYHNVLHTFVPYIKLHRQSHNKKAWSQTRLDGDIHGGIAGTVDVEIHVTTSLTS